MTRPILLSPADFANWVSTIGLFGRWGTEPIKINQYLSGSHSNGFNYTSSGFQSAIAKMVGKSGPTTGVKPTSLTKQWANMGKGQGYVEDFVNVWGWIYDNLDLVQDIKVDLKHDRTDHGKVVMVTERTNVPMSEFLTSKANFAGGMQRFINNRGYGWDCIGFVFNYLYQINVYRQYPGYLPHEYLKVGSGFKRTYALADIQPLSLVIFGSAESAYHITIVDSIQDVGKNSIKLTIAQSSSGGPQSNPGIVIRDSGDGVFFLSGPSPVTNKSVVIATNPDLLAVYPNSKPGAIDWINWAA